MRITNMPMSTLANGMHHRERIKASLRAIHLRGLSLSAGEAITAELFLPLDQPQFPENDHLFPIQDPTAYEENTVPVLSIYASSWDKRMSLPLEDIEGMALIPCGDELAGSFRPDSALACIAAHCRAGSKGGYLVLRRAGQEDTVLWCPRSLRQAKQIMEYYFQHIRPGDSPLPLSQLGAEK